MFNAHLNLDILWIIIREITRKCMSKIFTDIKLNTNQIW